VAGKWTGACSRAHKEYRWVDSAKREMWRHNFQAVVHSKDSKVKKDSLRAKYGDTHL
jgi:hypothetical protein